MQTHARLTEAVLQQIGLQRNGEVIQSTLLKSVLDSFVSLGIDDTDVTRLNLDVYTRDFQRAFLAATEAYYREESRAFLAANSPTDYMKKAESRLEEEEGRIGLYLHSSTRHPLMDACRAELISRHCQLLWDQFASFLENERADDLARMYMLLSQVPGGLDPLREQFEAHVRAAGTDAVARAAEAGAESIDPSKYVHALLHVYEHNARVIALSFQNEPGFIAALDKACRVFMNRNQATGVSASKSPELLARYIDSLLKKSSRAAEEGSVEEALDQAMVVFKYIEDRDYFLKFYSKFLARRLVTLASASSDAEESMIAKLKETCGFEYSNKLQRMFTEVGLSRELNERFRETCPQSEMDFSALVLANGIWPLHAPQSDFSVPSELQPMYEQFSQFYASQHFRRVLTWLWHLSSNDLHTTYLPRKHILQTSTYQCAVLLLFNTHTVLTFDEIAAATRLNETALQTTLLPLVKSKVLHQLDDSYSLNMGAYFADCPAHSDFKSKKVRVNLQVPVRSEQKAEVTEVQKTVDDDRKMLLQATIVRYVAGCPLTIQHHEGAQDAQTCAAS